MTQEMTKDNKADEHKTKQLEVIARIQKAQAEMAAAKAELAQLHAACCRVGDDMMCW